MEHRLSASGEWEELECGRVLCDEGVVGSVWGQDQTGDIEELWEYELGWGGVTWTREWREAVLELLIGIIAHTPSSPFLAMSLP